MRRNPPAAGAEAKLPDEAAIAPVREEEVARIKKLVEPLITTDVADGAKKGTVEVSWDYDFSEPAPVATMAAGLGDLVLGDWSPSQPDALSALFARAAY